MNNEEQLLAQRHLLLKCWRHTSRAYSELVIGAVAGMTEKQVEYIYNEIQAASCAIQELHNQIVAKQEPPKKDAS